MNRGNELHENVLFYGVNVRELHLVILSSAVAG
jgi:hypothetical protein